MGGPGAPEMLPRRSVRRSFKIPLRFYVTPRRNKISLIGDTLHPAHNLPLDMLVRVMDFKGDPLFCTGGHGIGGLRCLECGELLMLLMMNGGKCPLTFHHYENDARRRGANKVLTTIAAGDYAVFRKHGSKMDQRGTISSIFLYLAATGGKEAQHLSGLGGADIALIANVWCGAQHTMTQVEERCEEASSSGSAVGRRARHTRSRSEARRGPGG